jgi:hypothetical protein
MKHESIGCDWPSRLVRDQRVPENFNFGNIRTGEDAVRFIHSVTNSQRGMAAKLLHEHRHIVGNTVAYRGIIEAWLHDHSMVLSAFGSAVAVAAALRKVKPHWRETSVSAYRGVGHLDAALGLSWTTNRDVACAFAMCRNTPLVFQCEVQPENIVARCGELLEEELIVDPSRIDLRGLRLDDGNKEWAEIRARDLACPEDVPAVAIASWRAGAGRYAAFRNARWREALALARPTLANRKS